MANIIVTNNNQSQAPKKKRQGRYCQSKLSNTDMLRKAAHTALIDIYTKDIFYRELWQLITV